MSLLPSASGLDRALKCPGSTALPGIDSEAGAAADRGSIVHKFLELAAMGQREVALVDPEIVPPEHFEWCSKIDVEAILAEFER